MTIRVVIADDQHLVRSGFTMMLSVEDDIDVVGDVQNGELALAAARELKPDVILMDVQMPEMDGLEFLARVLQRSPDMPVVMMSGQSSMETAVKATKMGARDFMEKPVGLDRLLLTLRNALRLDHLERENRELQSYWRDELALIGESPGLRDLRALLPKLALAAMEDQTTIENATLSTPRSRGAV